MVIKIEVFKTDSCPHCPAAVSAAESAKAKLGDQIDVEIVNANDPDNIDRARQYQIMAVPTVVINGNVEFIGAPTDSELIQKLESLLQILSFFILVVKMTDENYTGITTGTVATACSLAAIDIKQGGQKSALLTRQLIGQVRRERKIYVFTVYLIVAKKRECYFSYSHISLFCL